MALEFSVLGSGSRGNCSVATLGNLSILIDVGFGPRTLQRRFEHAKVNPDRIASALITHTHGDHANDASLHWLARSHVMTYVHESIVDEMSKKIGFQALWRRGLVKRFEEQPFLAASGLWVEPFELRHSGPTFGFRIEGRLSRTGRRSALGYLTDTGSWNDKIVDALADVDLLGVEFNHDEILERLSGRSPALIARNLGSRGHLSNHQAAGLIDSILSCSGPAALKQVVLLHLSDECNRPDLAISSARQVFRDHDRNASIHLGHQNQPIQVLQVRPARRSRKQCVTGFPWET